MSFELKYVIKEGKNAKDSFLKSFFLAKDGPGLLRVVKATDVVPAEVQKMVFAGKESEVADPEAICESIKKESGNTFQGFLKWVEAQRLTVKAAIKKLVATTGDKDFDYSNWALNEKEIVRQDNKVDENPTHAWSEEEAKANKDLADKPEGLPGHGKKIKDFFNRLPDAGGVGEPTKAIDVKSKSLSGPLKLLREAMAREEAAKLKAEAAEKKAAELEDKLKKKAEEEQQSAKAAEIDSILHELTEMGFEEAELETTRKMLSTIDDRALQSVRELCEMIESKNRAEGPTAPGAGGPDGGFPGGAPKPEEMGAFGSLEEGDVPPVVLPADKVRQAASVDAFSQMWAQDTIARASR
jgi:hypothetical protein